MLTASTSGTMTAVSDSRPERQAQAATRLVGLHAAGQSDRRRPSKWAQAQAQADNLVKIYKKKYRSCLDFCILLDIRGSRGEGQKKLDLPRSNLGVP